MERGIQPDHQHVTKGRMRTASPPVRKKTPPPTSSASRLAARRASTPPQQRRSSAARSSTPPVSSGRRASDSAQSMSAGMPGKPFAVREDQPMLLRPCTWRDSDFQSVRDAMSTTKFPTFSLLQSMVLSRGAAFEITCGKPLKEVLPSEFASKSYRGESWITVQELGSAVEAVLYVRPQEVANEGFWRLFDSLHVIPRATRCWWRVCHEHDLAPDRPRDEAILDVSVQPLSVDGALDDAGVDILGPLWDVPLKPHQLRSINWMATREHVDSGEFICEWHTSKRLPWEKKVAVRDTWTRRAMDELVPLFLEWRIEEEFQLRGGVLADPIGSGKTLTCLSLCVELPGPSFEQLAELEQELVPLAASLVLCPEQVFHQWLSEPEKFGLHINLIPVVSGTDLLSLDIPRVVRSSKKQVVVIAPYSLFVSDGYKRCRSPLRCSAWLQNIDSLRTKVLRYNSTAQNHGLALEAFAWRRIFYDEFHELHQAKGTKRSVLQFLRAAAHWGVTGTPQDSLRTVDTACKMARMFGCEFNTARSASEFVQRYFRTNEVDVPVEVEWRTKSICLSRHERLIYESVHRDLCSHGSQRISVEMLARIVRQCSHFSSEDLGRLTNASSHSSGGLSDAKAAKVLYEAKRTHFEKAAEETSKGWWQETYLMGAEDDLYFRKVDNRFKHQRRAPFELRQDSELTQDSIKALRTRLHEIHAPARDAMGSFLFFHEAWNFATGQDADENKNGERQCSVCFDSYSFSAGALLRCGHTFCAECIQTIMHGERKCPLCRCDLSGSGGVAYAAKLLQLVCTPKGRFAEFGSKLQCIVETLLEVRMAEMSARFLLFVQWRDLEDKISAALDEFGVPHVRLSTCDGIFQRRDVLHNFQAGLGPCVLLLSLEQSASGAHLTAASHIFLVHPMVASTAELARAYEQQAVGRAVRLGQDKKVTIWRFVALDTVEQDSVQLLQGPSNPWANDVAQPMTSVGTSEDSDSANAPVATAMDLSRFDPPPRQTASTLESASTPSSPRLQPRRPSQRWF